MTWEPGEKIFALSALRAELDAAEAQPSFDDEERLERWVYLGTVFSLMPSGKFYMPWACSNVEPCPRCQGRGVVDNPTRACLPEASAAVLAEQAQVLDRKIRELAVRHYGYACEGEWPNELDILLARTAQAVQQLAKRVECPECEGVGSVEAMLDEKWIAQAEEELAEIDASLASGEGDPCDLFAVRVEEDEG